MENAVVPVPRICTPSSDGRLKCIVSTSVRDDISKVGPSRLPRAIAGHVPVKAAIRQEA